MTTLDVNGQRREVDAEPSMPLLWALRDVLGLTGTKYGCGIAQCGACTVHVDGQATRSCVTPVSSIVGRGKTGAPRNRSGCGERGLCSNAQKDPSAADTARVTTMDDSPACGLSSIGTFPVNSTC